MTYDMNVDLDDMSTEALVEEIVALRKAIKDAKAVIARKNKTIESLQREARKYYRAASDYVPVPERDYD